MSDASITHPEKGERDDPVVPTTLFVGAISVIIIIVVSIGVDILYRWTVESEHQRKVVDRESERLLQLDADQQRLLEEYRWIDRESGRLGIPIERAMELLVAEEAGR